MFEFNDTKDVLSLLSGIFVASFYFLLYASLRKSWTPNAASWFIWTFNDTLILFASISAHANNTLIVPLVYVVLGWPIVIFALIKGTLVKNKLEIVCITLSILGWASYFLPIGPLTALIIGATVNALGAFPTIARIRRDPKAESIIPWSIIGVGSVLSLASLEKLTLELLIFPLTSMLLNAAILLAILLNLMSSRESNERYN